MFKELEPAILAYRDLGFTVVPGGELPVGTPQCYRCLLRRLIISN
jgi:hypothetical protein